MIASIELQVISKLLTTEEPSEIEILTSLDESYYSIFRPHIHFILTHYQKYNSIPDVFTFQAEYPDVVLVTVKESINYLIDEMKKNKQHIMLLDMFNKLKDLGSGDVKEAWQYIANQCDKVANLDSIQPMDIIKDAKSRSEQVIAYSKQSRIPTGFDEIDKLMYGGLSTVEELLLIVARTNTGKSWVCTKMMESAQKHGFPVLYYSPEMQASFLGTRFDTWRGHFQNSQLYQGKYNETYQEYLRSLPNENTSAYILEDKDVEDNTVNVPALRSLVKKYGIKLLIIDGLSYMEDSRRNYSDTDYIKYKNICSDLFKLSKQLGCAVVVAMQANRATQDTKDDKGQSFPSLYNCEGSDHPGRIATQAFSLRQVFDKHVLDIRLEKSRMANNQKPICSYAWDVNTGNMQYLPGGDDDDPMSSAITPPNVSIPHLDEHTDDLGLDEIDDDDVEF